MLSSQGRLDGRVALVTGAASGIGHACVRALTEAGAKVHAVDIDADAVQRVAAEHGGWAHTADLADPAAVEELPSEVDVLVNNAGFQHVAALHEFPPEVFARMQQVMVTTPFLLVRKALPHMRERGHGRIVNVSSVHGLRASAYKSAYVTAKHALEGLSKVAALEGAAHGITSNCVNPGYVDTRLVRDQVRDQAEAHGMDESDVISEVLLQRAAVKQLITPEEVADVVRWLSGDQAAHITGTSVPLDGGWTAS
ncbi:3-hydroxybutyrate dehydrogenase [Saccharopolyspora rhizosphaerae]|uniref:3-hydroxybutyrate dehydrogenase n=1 Tax=Saccharopolyspora rhizosphaerae TaxID=2492662 RepID=A0A3R8PBJ1_9PSEU|nr:3-hydroxybutyrate dehydrogenase [Saccharopolyspora rhizosphaerae]RRO20704.1 3-hydroxybutyrate dehydrogenase [Saccharopolyspora rhizosphaerae]